MLVSRVRPLAGRLTALRNQHVLALQVMRRMLDIFNEKRETKYYFYYETRISKIVT
jgi:hypothetical protein